MRRTISLCALALLCGCPPGGSTDDGGTGGGSGGGSGGGAGGGGETFVSRLGEGYEGEGMAVVPCGTKLCVAGGVLRLDGGRAADFLAARFELNGTRDVTFGDRGVAAADFDGGSMSGLSFALDVAYALTMDGDKLVLAGSARNTVGPAGGSFALARFNADGTLDSSFSGDGLALLQVGTVNNSSRWTQVRRLSSGKYLVAGHIENGSARGQDFVVAVYNADGTPDPGFVQPGGTGFGHIAHLGFTNEQALSLIEQPGGYVVGGGSFGVTRFLPSGAIDTTFADAGLYRGGPGDLDAIVPRSDGRLWLFGVRSAPNPDGGTTDVLLLKQQLLSANGVPESSFGTAGTRELEWPIRAVRGVALEPGDKALLYTDGFPTKVMRLSSDGTLDVGYGHGGSLDAGTSLPILPSPVRGPANKLVLANGRAFLTDFTVHKVSESRTVQTFVLEEVQP